MLGCAGVIGPGGVKQGAVQTLDATQTAILRIGTETDKSLSLKVDIVGVQSDGSKAVNFVRRYSYKNDGGVLTLNGLYTGVHEEVDGTLWSVALVVSISTIVVKVTGAAGVTINWKAKVEVFR